MTYEASPDEQPIDWSLVEVEDQSEGSYLFRSEDLIQEGQSDYKWQLHLVWINMI